MEDNHDYTTIEKYVKNELEGSSLSEFENKVANDATLAKEVEFYKQLAEVTKFKGLFEEAEKEMEEEVVVVPDFKAKKTPSSEKNIFHLSRRVLALAASVLVLVLATWWLFSSSEPNPSPELIALADKNFVHYPMQARGDEPNPTLYANYKSKKYELASVELEKYAIENKDNNALLYSAIAYLGMDNPNRTIALLNNLEGEESFQNRKYYYMGLAYLKKEQKEEAVDALKRVNDFDIFLYNKAVNLITTLEK